jgi:signal peptidase I
MQPAGGVEVTAPPLEARRGLEIGRAYSRRLLALATSVLVPAIVSLLALRYLVPSRLEGADGGLRGAWAWLGDQHPLFLGLALFLAISEAGRYWLNRLRPGGVGGPVAVRSGLFRSQRGLVMGLALVAFLAFVVRASFVATYRVVGPSMLPTLEIGDRMIVNPTAYGLTVPLTGRRLAAEIPRRGDLVVFGAEGIVAPGASEGAQSVVKRVIGLPGDRVYFANASLYINEWKVPTCDAGPYVSPTGDGTIRGRLTVEYLNDSTYLTVRDLGARPSLRYTVNPGEVYVVGDDRGASSDSRSWNHGLGAGVPTAKLEGRVTRVLFGALPDGRLDFSRVLVPPLDLKVHMPGIDLRATDKRIADCLARRPSVTWPPLPLPAGRRW